MQDPKDVKPKKSTTPPKSLKPAKPDTKGAPNDKDPEAQYENKDES